MDQVTLQAGKRDEVGSRPARRLRRTGLVPAVVYGTDLAPLRVTVAGRDLNTAFRTEAGLNALFNLELDGESVLTVAREIQRHPVRGDITHLDFVKVSLDVAIQADVGIDLIGTPVGVREEEGVVEQISMTIAVRALPTEIPSSFELDIDLLNIGDTLKVSDLPAIEGVEILDDGERPIVTILAPRKIEEEVPEVDLEGLELEEGEELPEGEEAAEGEDAEAEGE